MRTVMAEPKSVNGSGLDIPRLAAEHLHLDIEVLRARLLEIQAIEESLEAQLSDLEAMHTIAKRLCENPGTLSLRSHASSPSRSSAA